jgi:hypothetical protein
MKAAAKLFTLERRDGAGVWRPIWIGGDLDTGLLRYEELRSKMTDGALRLVNADGVAVIHWDSRLAQ